MKKLISFLCIFLCNISMAQNSFYCPEKIVCSEFGQKDSCEFNNDYGYWVIEGSQGNIQNGTYQFQQAFSAYQSPSPSVSYCDYYNQDAGYMKTIRLKSVDNVNLQAYKDVESRWIVYGYGAECDPGVTFSQCPLVPYIKN